jgi:hypothetical protein
MILAWKQDITRGFKSQKSNKDAKIYKTKP